MQSAVKSTLKVSLLLWSLFGAFAWMMRDGLGPDSVESSGWGALVRAFWTFYWGPVFVGLVLASVALRGRLDSSQAGRGAAQLDSAADGASPRS